MSLLCHMWVTCLWYPELEGNSSGGTGEREANQWPTAEPPVCDVSSSHLCKPKILGGISRSHYVLICHLTHQDVEWKVVVFFFVCFFKAAKHSSSHTTRIFLRTSGDISRCLFFPELNQSRTTALWRGQNRTFNSQTLSWKKKKRSLLSSLWLCSYSGEFFFFFSFFLSSCMKWHALILWQD